MHELTFNIIEYLKGTDAQQIIVTVYGDHWFGTEDAAQKRADKFLIKRDTQWDNLEGMLFIEQIPPGGWNNKLAAKRGG